MIRRRVLRAGTAALVLAGTVSAEQARPVWLGGPEVTLSSWSATLARAADMDGDGRTDLVVADPGRAMVRWYRQRAPGEAPPTRRAAGRARWEPVLEDARFEENTIAVGSPVVALAAADLDGDGRTDLAMTTSKEPLLLLYREADGEWTRRETMDGFKVVDQTGSLAATDVDADGRTDIVVLAEGEILVFRRGDEGRFLAPLRHPMTSSGAFGLIVEDLDGDGLTDITYTVGDSDLGWRVHFQMPPVLGQGLAFGPERAIPVRVDASGAAIVKGLPGGTALAVVEGSTTRTEIARLSSAKTDVAGLARWRVETLAVGTSDRAPARFGLGDLDGDGRVDLVAGDPRGAKVTLFRQRPDGRFGESATYPTVANLSALVTGRFGMGGRVEVVVASDKDEIVGVSKWMPSASGEARLSFPEPIRGITGSPVLLAAVPAGDRDALVVVTKRASKYTLETLLRGELWLSSPAPGLVLDELRRDPEFARVGDLDGDGRQDLLIFGREAAQVLLGRESEWVPTAVDNGLRRTMLAGVEPFRVSVLDLDADGRAEILVGDTGFVRVLELVGGQLVAKDQLTARQGDDRLLAPLLLPLDEAGPAVVCATGAGPLQALRKGTDGVWRFAESAEIPPLSLRDHAARALAPGEEPHLILFGSDRVHLLSPTIKAWERNVLASYETDLIEVEPRFVETGDLNGDDRPELVSVDSRRGVIEVLGLRPREADEQAPRARTSTRGRASRAASVPEEWTLESVLHFEIFEANPFVGGRRSGREPREVLVVDVTSDGLADLVCLVHDRLLVYPQRRVDEGSGVSNP